MSHEKPVDCARITLATVRTHALSAGCVENFPGLSAAERTGASMAALMRAAGLTCEEAKGLAIGAQMIVDMAPVHCMNPPPSHEHSRPALAP